MKSIKNQLERVERLLFLAFMIALPFQARVLIARLGGDSLMALEVNEWLSAWAWVSDALLIALLIMWVARGIALRDLMPLALIVIVLPALVFHPTAIAFWRFAKLAEGLLLVAYIRTRRSWITDALAHPRAFLAILTGILISAAVGIVQFVLQRDLGLSFLGESPLALDTSGVANFVVQGAKIIRAYGFTPHPNILGVLLAAALIVVVFLYVFRGIGRRAVYSFKRQREEFIRGGTVLLLLMALVLTFSRMAWLGAALTLGFFLVVLFFNKAMRRLYLWEAMRFTLLFVSLLAVVVIAFWPFLKDRVATSFVQDQAISQRSDYAEEALAMIKEHPVTGVGLGGYVTEFARRNPTAPAWSIQPVHNVVLLLAAEMGWPAMALIVSGFVTLVIVAVRRFRKEHDPSIALIGAMVLSLSGVLLVASLGDHLLWTSQQGSLLLWLVIGLLAQPAQKGPA